MRQILVSLLVACTRWKLSNDVNAAQEHHTTSSFREDSLCSNRPELVSIYVTIMVIVENRHVLDKTRGVCQFHDPVVRSDFQSHLQFLPEGEFVLTLDVPRRDMTDRGTPLLLNSLRLMLSVM